MQQQTQRQLQTSTRCLSRGPNKEAVHKNTPSHHRIALFTRKRMNTFAQLGTPCFSTLLFQAAMLTPHFNPKRPRQIPSWQDKACQMWPLSEEEADPGRHFPAFI